MLLALAAQPQADRAAPHDAGAPRPPIRPAQSRCGSRLERPGTRWRSAAGCCYSSWGLRPGSRRPGASRAARERW